MTGQMTIESNQYRKLRYAATGSMRMLDEAGNEYLVTKYNVLVKVQGAQGMVWEKCETQLRTATGARVVVSDGHYLLQDGSGAVLIPKPAIEAE